MKRSYTTQMDAARKGILTPQMEQVLEHEAISQGDLMEKLSRGHIAIPANRNHLSLKAAGVGEGLKTKINVNLGVSKDVCSFDAEMAKAKLAIDYKADAVMDLSVSGDTEGFRKRLVKEIPVMIGTVPIYDTLTRTGKPTREITIEDWFETVEIHAQNGIDFLTIHAGLNRKCVTSLRANIRRCGVVSRGGAILFEWMEKQRVRIHFMNILTGFWISVKRMMSVSVLETGFDPEPLRIQPMRPRSRNSSPLEN